MKLQAFIEFCKTCNDTEQIYDAYYNDAELCEEIYAEAERLGVVLQNCNEPMRASLEAIGSDRAVAILANW